MDLVKLCYVSYLQPSNGSVSIKCRQVEEALATIEREEERTEARRKNNLTMHLPHAPLLPGHGEVLKPGWEIASHYIQRIYSGR